MDTDNTSFTIWPQPGGHRVGFTQLIAPNGFNVDNLMVDPWSGTPLLIQNEGVYYIDFTDPLPLMQTYIYRSKIYQSNNKKNYSAMRVFFTIPTNTPPQNPQPNEAPTEDPSWQALGIGQYGIIQVYASADIGGAMKLVTTREIRKSGGLLRILGGFKAEEWQFRVIGRVPVSNIQIATSIQELGNV